jgi:uncharacterized protein (TIGR03083 family)
MDPDEVWRTIDQQREELADLMETFTDTDWETHSLCEAWRVRDVAAHLTLATMSTGPALVAFARAGFGFNRMIRDTAVRQAELPVEQLPARLRAMSGSRKKAPTVSMVEPMLDTLVHGQDMAIPLGRAREMPREAAAVAATRAWKLNWPFHVRKRLDGFSLTATDHPWTIGAGPAVGARMQDLLMLVAGRDVVLPDLDGPGADALRQRLASKVS